MHELIFGIRTKVGTGGLIYQEQIPLVQLYTARNISLHNMEYGEMKSRNRPPVTLSVALTGYTAYWGKSLDTLFYCKAAESKLYQ